MRRAFLLFWFSLFPVMADAALPTFFGPPLVEINQPYSLALAANQADVARWKITWGDGTTSEEQAGATLATHTYGKATRCVVKVEAIRADGSSVPAIRDVARLIDADRPVATTDRQGDGNVASAQSLAVLDALTTKAPLKSSPLIFEKIFPGPVDQFTVEFWLRPTQLNSRQDLMAGQGSKGRPTLLSIDGRALVLALPGGDVYRHPLGAGWTVGAWHHVAVTYDRSAMFPYSNTARFYLDGQLDGEYHLDRYDTGPVDLRHLTMGSSPGGRRALAGSLAEAAIYDRWLNPARILDRTRTVTEPGTQVLTVVPKNADTFSVDQPKIATTVDVALDPNFNADNGPVLRAAIEGAKPGTRVRVVNAATKKPGGRFYFNSLAKGNDWAVLRVIDKTDFELDGAGADFIFRTGVRQIAIKKSTRIAMRNFSIDLDQDKFRVACYARILDVDSITGTVRFQFIDGRRFRPDRTVPQGVSLWRWRSFNPKTLRIEGSPEPTLFYQTGDVFGKTMKRDPNDPSILIGQTTQKKMLAAFEKYRKGPNFLMVNNADFRNTDLNIWDQCSQITFDHVSVYADLGMVCLTSEYDHLWIHHCRIGPPPGMTAADRPLAAAADGFHFHENQGYTLFEDNEITLTDDDPISIKDGIWRDVTSPGPNTIHIKGFRVGEEIELYRWDLSPLNYKAKVTAVNGGDITVDAPLPDGLPEKFLAQNRTQRSYHWVLRNSSFHDYYGRFLVYTPWARITGNFITKSYLHIGTGAASFDGGGISSHVLADDNVLVDTNADTGLWGISSHYPVFQDIAFAGNSFLGRGLSLNNTGNALVSDNYFENVSRKDEVAVKLTEATQPQVLGNVQMGLELTAFGLATKTTEGLTAADNRTLSAPPVCSVPHP